MIYRFGAFELDAARRELRADGVPVELEPKAFELLVFLVENRDRAVGKNELQNELWPRMIVTETALTRCVMKARRAVNDDASRQAVIRTVHRHGYRFLPDVEVVAAGDGPPAAAAGTPDAPVRRTLVYRRPVIGAAIVLLLSAAVAWLALRDPLGDAQAGVVAVLPVDNRITDEGHAWARIGLMSLLSRMLADGGVEVASERAVLRVLGDADVGDQPPPEILTELRRQARAETVLGTTLERRGGLHRLSAVLTWPDGRRTRRVIVGESPARLAADLADVVVALLDAAAVPKPADFRRVSSDPFVNELYARGIDLELQGRFREARQLFETAAAEEPGLFWLRYEIALCTRQLREWDTAEAELEVLLAEATAADDTEARIAALNALGVTEYSRDRFAAARPWYEQAAVLAERPGFAEDRAAILVNLGIIERQLGNLAAARGHFEDALAAFESAGLDASPYLHNSFAGLLIETGDLAEAERYAEWAVQGFRALGQQRAEAASTNRLARILRRRGELDAALTRHEQAQMLYAEVGDVIGELGVRAAMTAAYRENGDLTRARLNAADVLERASAENDRMLLADAHMESGQVAIELGQHDAATAHFDAARELFGDLEYGVGVRSADAGRAAARLDAGDLDAARDLAAGLLDTARSTGDAGDVAFARVLMGEIALAAGQQAQARSELEAALAHARGSGNDRLLTRAARPLADALVADNRLDAAADLLDEIRPLAGRTHAFMRSDARLAAARGDHEKARRILNELRARAGEAWREDDEEMLASLESH